MKLKSRTRTGLLGGLLAAVIVLTGCSAGSAAPEGKSSEGSVQGLPAAEGKTSYPLTLETAWGESELTERPERIVALGITDPELLAAMNVQPVAAFDSAVARSVWLDGRIDTDQLTLVENADGNWDYEAIAAAKPDLIMSFGSDMADSYAKLKAIAPVLTDTSKEESTDWRPRISAAGKALDLAGAAEKATQEYDDAMAKVRAENPGFSGKSIAFILDYGEEYGISYSSLEGTSTAAVLQEIGFDPTVPKGIEEEISPEMISLITTDVLLVGAVESDPKVVEKNLTGTELFKQLPAVKSENWALFLANEDNSGYIFDGTEHEGNINWAIAHGGALLGKEWAVKQLVPMLNSALKLQ